MKRVNPEKLKNALVNDDRLKNIKCKDMKVIFEIIDKVTFNEVNKVELVPKPNKEKHSYIKHRDRWW